MMGLEPTTFCMASRRSSQLSYIRVGASIALVRRTPRPRKCGAAATRGRWREDDGEGPRSGCVQRLVHEAVGELVVRTAHVAVVDVAELPRQSSGLERELAKRLVLHLVLTEH